jgi:hypothetical protein
MKSVLITPKNETELKFISALLKKLGVSSKIISAEEVEDAGLSLLMKEADRSEKVSRSTIMDKLKS